MLQFNHNGTLTVGSLSDKLTQFHYQYYQWPPQGCLDKEYKMDLLMGFLNLGSGFNQYQAQKAQGEYQKQMFDMNAKLAELNSQDAIRRGDQTASTLRRENKKLMGSQRAALAAQGIDIDSGSALDIQNETSDLGYMDQITAKNNAWREAWGYKVESNNSLAQGNLAKSAANFSAYTSLATGGLRALDYFQKNTIKKAE